MPIEIEEVIRRSEQGVTEPYICRGSDGNIYYVKGKGAGYDSLVKEWVAGNLAFSLGLPIAPFKLVHVPKALYDAGRSRNLGDLGFGLVFGSEHIPNSNEISVLNIGSIPAGTKRDIVAFDWWVKNGDRTLTESGGNPNILWSESSGQPFIIDHNLAFDGSVTLNSQLESHIFAASAAEICETPALQAHYDAKFEMAIAELDNIVGDIPQRWHYVDDAETFEINFSIEGAKTLLARFRVRAFWERT
jgi:hypothetical protein